MDAFAPVVAACSPNLVAVSGGTEVQMLGIGLGVNPSAYLASLRIDDSPCVNVTRDTDVSIICVTSGASGGPGLVRLDTIFGWSTTSVPGVVQYRPPVIESLTTSPEAVFNAEEV